MRHDKMSETPCFTKSIYGVMFSGETVYENDTVTRRVYFEIQRSSFNTAIHIIELLYELKRWMWDSFNEFFY